MKTKLLITSLLIQSMALAALATMAQAAPTTLDVKKRGESEIRKVVEPLLNRYCHEQCQIIHVDTEVDLAIADVTTPGFEDSEGKASLAPAAGKLRILMDDSLGQQTRTKITNLLKEHLETLDYPVDIETRVSKFPQPAASNYRVADLRDRVSRDVKASVQGILTQFCPDTCLLGDFDIQTEVVNAEDVNYSSSQDFFQDGPAAVRVRGVKATIITDQSLTPEQANSVVEMAKLKVAAFKNSSITSQTMAFPKPTKNMAYGKNGQPGPYAMNDSETKEEKELREAKESRELHEAKDSREAKSENNTRRDNNNTTSADNKSEKFEHFEKIERVESGDAVQQVLEKFRIYGIVFSAIVLALLLTLVAISFRKQIFETINKGHVPTDITPKHATSSVSEGSGVLTHEDKATLLGKRIEAENLFNELTNVFSEQPKVAKHVFTNVLTEEGVEVTAQYLEIFGESVVMDLLRDPGLQSDLAELMDFFSRNTFDTNDDERLQLLKRLQHRTVTAKMQVHGSRSATLFDFLAEMDAPQIVEMVKNESNTVKAIVLTQCDSKKRQGIFNSHDELTRLKLMTELSRIDHLPKNYIYNVATALRRKKNENPKLNTEALPGTDVLVTFLEKADIGTQRAILQQLMSTSGSDALQNLKSKLVSIETLRFVKEQHLTDIITNVKHDELVQFLKGSTDEIRNAILGRVPSDLAGDLSDAINLTEKVSRDTYNVVERKILNRMKVLANNGAINIGEINERIFADEFGFREENEVTSTDMRRVG